MRIAPGEPVPPGFENEVKPVCMLKPLIDRCHTALIGLEYVVELILGKGVGPSYYCVQCRDHSSSSATAMAHVKSYNHRLRYLQVHYPGLVGNIKPFLSQSNAEKVLAAVVDKICMAIEDVYGRLTPTVYENAEFMKKRNAFIQKIKNGRHFDEASGAVVDYSIDLKEIQMAFNGNSQRTAPIDRKERNLSPITGQLKHLRREAFKMRNANLEAVSSGDDQSMSSHRNPSRERDHNKGRISASSTRENLSERGREVKVPPKSSTLENWGKDVQSDFRLYEQYKMLIDGIINEMEADLQRYKDNPQTHPLYPSEWDMFWEKRSNELEAAGEDPYAHNFTFEWSMFFLKRMNELHEADIERKKLEVRQILGIPPTANFKMPSMAPSSSSLASVPKKPKYQATESSSSDRKPARSTIPTNRENSRETKNRSHVEKPQMSNENKSYGKRKQIFTSIDKLEAISDDEDNGVEKSLDNLDDDNGVVDESLTVISVLRLLTAFEDMLGSLGPKVVDLLSKAVALEKVRPNLADELLMSADNSVLLDTVKEKLKGLIIAGMVQGKREQAIRKAIRNVGGIVRLIDRKPKEKPKASTRQTASDTSQQPIYTMSAQRLNMNEDHRPTQYHSNHIPGTNPSAPLPATSTKRSNSEAERREDVLKQLATSLMLQGRNVSNEQLEGLVDVYLANHSSSDTPYLFGLQMGERLAKMEDARKVAQAAAALTAGQAFNSILNNDMQSGSVALQNRNSDHLTMSNYGGTSNDQQHRFGGDSSFQQQSQPQVQSVRDNMAWMSSSSYGIGDTDNRANASQSHHQSGMQAQLMSINEERWQNPQVQPMPYAESMQQSYEQPTSRYSSDSYRNDQMKGPQPWGSGASQMSQSQYKGNQQQSQGQQHYQQHQPNTYGQRPNAKMGQQQQNRTQKPDNQFKNKKQPNLSSGLKQVQLHSIQQQSGQSSAQRQQGNKPKQGGHGNNSAYGQRFAGNQRNQNQKQFNNF